MTDDVTRSVAALYDAFPFPPDPVIDEAPPGYNWRWHWQSAYAFCTNGQIPTITNPRILDAGCGSGVSTEYLAHQNPQAQIVAIDISQGTLQVAQERILHSIGTTDRVQFHHCSIYDLDQISGEFDLINCVGVLHHLADPDRGLQSLVRKLKPGGLLHLFLYGEIGRWEISLMQEALQILREDKNDIAQGVKLGRSLFATLPENNRLVQREKTRWFLENTKDECFADMYLHPHEIRFNINSLFAFIDRSGLEFAGFSNPKVWQLDRLLGNNPELLAKAQALPQKTQYRLLELLDTDIAHYEFFLFAPPLPKLDTDRDEVLLSAKPLRHPCIMGWSSKSLFNPDYEVCNLTDAEFEFMEQANQSLTTAQILAGNSQLSLATVRSLLSKRLLLFAVN
ncbi:MAG: methyltransferase domain-containing protein [Cyanobacteria bacterium KgW148]|nr:methyltransferase domain-containing protein [Cyanobacteria bacterium KgW148]